MSKSSTRIKEPTHERPLMDMAKDQQKTADKIRASVDAREARMAEFDPSKALRRAASANHAKGMRDILATMNDPVRGATALAEINGGLVSAKGSANRVGSAARLQGMSNVARSRMGATDIATASLSRLNDMQSQLQTQKMQNKMQRQMDIVNFGLQAAGGYMQGQQLSAANAKSEARHNDLMSLLAGGG